MQINLTEVLSSGQKAKEWTVPLELDTFVSVLGSFPISKKSPLHLTVTNLSRDRLQITGEAEIWIVIPCDRCLSDVETYFLIHIDRELEVRPADEEKNGCQESLDPSEEEEEGDIEVIFGYQMDADELVCREIFVNWPMKTLCRKDCKGICKKCGANLNHGSCSCDTVELDPRMAAIRDIFNKSNEEV